MMMGEPSTLLLRRASGPANLVQKFRATAALCASTGKQKPQINVHLLSGGYLERPLGMGREKKRTENNAERSVDAAAVYSLERKEREAEECGSIWCPCGFIFRWPLLLGDGEGAADCRSLRDWLFGLFFFSEYLFLLSRFHSHPRAELGFICPR